MELTPFVERLRRDLSDAAAAGGPEAQAAGRRLDLEIGSNRITFSEEGVRRKQIRGWVS